MCDNMPTEYTFYKSDDDKYKYKVIYKNVNNRNKVVYFGQHPTSNHYKDSTGLGLYSHLDHNNEKWREYWKKQLSYRITNNFMCSKKNYPEYSEFWEYRYLY